MPKFHPSRARRRRHATRLLALALAIMLVPTALAAPRDIQNSSAPTVGADPPKAQDIGDGDLKVATSTGAATYAYPIAHPPGRLGMEPSIALSYSSQAPVYGGIAAGWSLSGLHEIKRDMSRGLRDEAVGPAEFRFMSTMAGGNTLVKNIDDPTATGVVATYRAQHDATFARYQQMAAGQPFRWRVLTTDGVTHTFGDTSLITVPSQFTTAPTDARAPLTRSRDVHGNLVEYQWRWENDEYRIETIRYGANDVVPLQRFAEIRFTYEAAPLCEGTPIGSALDFRLRRRFLDGASRLTKITAVALDPLGGDLVQHTREVDLVYRTNATSPDFTERCGAAATHAPYRELWKIQEKAWGPNAPMVTLPPMEFGYGDVSMARTAELPSLSWVDAGAGAARPRTLSWGYREQTHWPTVEAMLVDLDGDGLLDRVSHAPDASSTNCVMRWQRNPGPGSSSFVPQPDIQLPRMPWANGAGGQTGLGTMNAAAGERCALNYQFTMRDTGDGPTSCKTGAYLVYRWMDMDNDQVPDLVTAIHHNPGYDPNDPLEPKPFAWPSCPGQQAACPALEHECMEGAYFCDEFDGCGIDELQAEACTASAPLAPCEQLMSTKTSSPESEAALCLATQSVDCGLISWVGNPDPPGCPPESPHRLCNGLYLWIYYKNDKGQIDLQAPQYRFQPVPLESFTGDSSTGPGSFVSQFHAITDLDGDGTTDAVVPGRWDDLFDPQHLPPTPYWWWVFPGDGNGGFVINPTTNRHGRTLFVTPLGAAMSASVGGTLGFAPDWDRYWSSKAELTDINGDGLADYIADDLSVGSPEQDLTIYYNDGKRFREGLGGGVALPSTHPPIAYGFVDSATGGVDGQFVRRGTRALYTRRIDLDADGRLDVYHRALAGSSGPKLLLNAGGSFVDNVALASGLEPVVRQESNLVDDPRLIWETVNDLADLDGDGLPERVSWDGATMVRLGVPTPASAPPRLLVSIKNGRGLATKVDYAPLSDKTVVDNDPHAAGSTASPRTQWVVKSVTVEDDFESTDAVTTYKYDDPVFGPDNDGVDNRYSFRGFKQVTATGPKLQKTIERYDFSVDKTGRLVSTANVASDGMFDTIAQTMWEERDTFGSVHTFHVKETSSFKCRAGQTESACLSSPAGLVKSASTWQQQGLGPAGAFLLWVETRKTLQDSVAFDDGDRATETEYLVLSDGTRHRLRTGRVRSFARTAGVEVLYASKRTLWDAELKVPHTEERQLDAAGTLATTTREFEPTGQLKYVRKPNQQPSGPRSRQYYDSKQLFVTREENELGHTRETDRDYGTGAVIAVRGSNTRSCEFTNPNSCPPPSTPPLPTKDGSRTRVDGLGRPLEIEVVVHQPGSLYDVYVYSLVETFAYTDSPPSTTVPAFVLNKKRIENTENRWTEVKTEIDGHGRPIRTTEEVYATAPADAVTSYDYDENGKLVAVAVPDPSANSAAQVTFTYSFDSLGRPTGMRRPDSTVEANKSGINIAYCGLVEVREEVAGAAGGPAARTELETDAHGRLSKVREFLQPATAGTCVTQSPSTYAETTYQFSPRDEVKTIIDPEGVTTVLEHDFGGRRTKITRGPREWRYEYDLNGNMSKEITPNTGGAIEIEKHTTTFIYDVLDRLTDTYLAPRNLSADDLRLFGADRIHLEWDRDTLNRTGRLVYARRYGPNNVLSFVGRYTYDVEGNPAIDGRTLSIDIGTGAQSPQLVAFPEVVETTTFAPHGKPRSVLFADEANGETRTQASTIYDDRGNPRRLSLSRHGLAAQSIGVQDRNVAGLVTKRRTDQSSLGVDMQWIESVWTYDKLGRVSSQVINKDPSVGDPSTQVAAQHLTYWGNDDPKTLDHYLGPTNHKKLEFVYDKRHQLTDVTETAAGGAFSASYDYGPAGRFSSAIVTPTALPGGEVRPRNVVYDYDATDPEALSQLTIAGGIGIGTPYATYSYDLAGNQVSRTYLTDTSLPHPQPSAPDRTWTFIYDGEDQLRRVIDPDGNKEEYWYDHEGRRTLVRKTQSGPTATSTIEWRVFHRNTEVEFGTTGTQGVVPSLTKTVAYASLGTPLLRIEDRNDRAEFQFHGLTSSMLAAIESGVSDEPAPGPVPSGSVNAGFLYSPFGEIVESAGPESEAHRRRMNDKYHDISSGLAFYGARYFDNVSALWTQADPRYRFTPDAAWRSPRRACLYSFSSNNPLRYLDPDGKDFIEAILKNDALGFVASEMCGNGCYRAQQHLNNRDGTNHTFFKSNSQRLDVWQAGASLIPAGRVVSAAVAAINMAVDAAQGQTSGPVDPFDLMARQPGGSANSQGQSAGRLALPAGKERGRQPGPTTDPATGQQVGRFVTDPRGNTMIEPVGGQTRPAGPGGVDTHTLYPNGSNYQRLNPQGHANNPTPHGHGHLQGTGPGKNGQGQSIDPQGNPVPWTSAAAHWDIK